MQFFFFLNFLNFIFLLNFFSYYNFSFFNVDFLFFFIFIVIFLNFFVFLKKIINNFLWSSKFELLKEFYLNLLNSLYLINVYKIVLWNSLKNLNFLFILFKFLHFFMHNFLFVLLNKLFNFLLYSNLNLLNMFFFDKSFLKKKNLIFFFKIKIQKMSNKYFYWNLIFREFKIYKWILNI